MATPINGNKLGVFIDIDNDINNDSGATTVRLLALSTSASLSFSNSTIEVASKTVNAGGTLQTSSSTTHAFAGASSWSISADGLLDLSSPATAADDATTDATGTVEHGFQNLMTLALAGTKVRIYFQDASSAGATASKGYEGTAFIESIEASGGVDDFATYSVTFKGDGDLSLIVNS